jgi:hypothetical protein
MGRRVQKKEKVHLKIQTCKRREPTNDYLKFYRVVRHWAKKKYGLSEPDLEMLYFLYSEHLFSRQDFEDYDNIMSWDKSRFDRLLKDGWIIKWRKEGMDKNRWALYCVSFKCKRAITSIYKKLNGEEDFSMRTTKNPVIKKTAGFADKTVAQQMRKINERNRERRLTAVHARRDGAR